MNVELPTQTDLDRLAPDKDLVQIRRAMGGLREHITEAHTREQTRAWAREVRLVCDQLGPGMLQVAYNNNHANYATTNAAEFGEDLLSLGCS